MVLHLATPSNHVVSFVVSEPWKPLGEDWRVDIEETRDGVMFKLIEVNQVTAFLAMDVAMRLLPVLVRATNKVLGGTADSIVDGFAIDNYFEPPTSRR